MSEVENIQKIIEKIVNEIKEKREKIEIPDIPNRCESCIDGVFKVDNISFNCEALGENRCLIYREFLKENLGKNIFVELDKVEEGIRDKIKKYIDNIHKFSLLGKGLTIIGSIGTGKTSILFLIIQKLYKEGIEFFYKYSFELFETPKEDFISKKFLLIDDLGAEYQNEFNKKLFDYIIDYRYRFKLPTIITSNLSIKKIQEYYPRAYDRLRSMNFLIILEGGSRR